MNKEEKRLLDANIKLVEERRTLIRDILVLINFINGDKELKPFVEEIEKYYKNKK